MLISSPERGFVSTTRAANWEEALISGNGKMGALVMGDPVRETVILSRHGLYLPLHEPLPPVDTASHLGEIRDMMSRGEYQKAADYVVELSHKEGWGNKRWTDPFVPAFDVLVSMQRSGEAKGYSRGVDFATGVVSVRWEDNRGAFLRRLFVSRPDNVVVLSITGPGRGKVDCELQLAQRPGAWGVKDVLVEADGDWMTYRTSFGKRWPGSLQGCEGAARVIVKNGTREVEGKKIVVTGADEVLVLVRVALTKDFAKPGIEDMKKALASLGGYDALLRRHAKVHGGIFNRVRLDLGGGEDRALTSEELLAKSKVGSLNKALLEKEFDAARYAILSSSGDAPPNLQGIWAGTWRPPWSGDYTQNGNIQSAIASMLSANMPECMESYFKYIDSQMDDYRENARRMYGWRGFHVASRTSSHGLNNHFDRTWPMTFWTAGAGWTAHFYYDYYLYTGDEEFLLTRALPLMKEAAAFYEDCLIEGKDGRYLFSPSYSPENNPGNNPSQACINATMDIAVAKELLTNLVTVCEKLKTDPDGVKRWKAMLARMPDYMINKDGAVKEYTTPDLDDNYGHRHCSHLYPLYDGMAPDIEASPELRKAFQRAADLRMEVRRREGGGVMAFGLVQLGLAFSSLRDAQMSYEVIDWLANSFWRPSMVTTHDPGSIFNVDLCGGLPAVVIKMLVYSQPGLIELLPALPQEWPTGRVEGLPCRGQVTVVDLKWSPGGATVVLQSAKAQAVTLRMPYAIKLMDAVQGEATVKPSSTGSNCREVTLPAGKKVTLKITAGA